MTHPTNRWFQTKDLSADAYDERYDRRAAAGENVHGEADLVMRYAPAAVLDAGCGTGRIARELARRGVEVVGVDLDPEMLATARRRSPEGRWIEGDLATFRTGLTFDLILAAGNVMILLTPSTEGAVIANLAHHLRPGGRLVAGFQLSAGGLPLQAYDDLTAQVGLRLEDRWSTWDHEPWRAGGSYAVSVHQLTDPTPL